MTDNEESGGPFKLILVIGIVALVGIVFVALSGNRDDEAEQPTPGQTGEEPAATEGGETKAADPAEPEPVQPAAENKTSRREESNEPAEERPNLGKAGGPETPYTPGKTFADHVAKLGKWNPPRPLRFVVRHGNRSKKGWTSEKARAHADGIRERFLAGESSYTLIREHSDPPTRIPQELISQWEKLAPTEASPVIPVEDGFVLFFGTPTSPPDAGR